MVGTPLYCPRLIGRSSELAALADLARRAAGGETVFAFVSGDAGAGKTRLIEELRRHMPRGMHGVIGTCMEYAPSPMGSVLDIIAALEAEYGAPSDARVTLPTGDDPVDKRRLFERAGDALRRAGAATPFAMILDDTHWADSVTLDLLQFLIGTLRDARVLVVAAYRTDELAAAHPLHALVARATRGRNVQHIELEPLGHAQIQELIDATLPKKLRLTPEARRAVRDRSEGNPLFAEEFLKTMADGVRVGETQTILPPSLRGLLVERLQRIDAEHLRLLKVAALIGRRFSAALLGRIAEWDVRALEPFLRVAIDEHFLVEDRDEPGWFTFRHALTRDTILTGLLAVQARGLHIRIAQEIEREPMTDARVLEVAEHYWRAAAFADCGPYATRAGDLAKSRHAYAEAAELYERALACGPSDESELVALHEKAASAYASLGSPRKVLEHLDVAVAYYNAQSDAAKLVEVYLDLTLAYRGAGETDRAFEVLHRASELSKRTGSEKLVLKSAVQLAQFQALAEEWELVAAHVREAEPLLGYGNALDVVRFYVARAAMHLARYELQQWRSDSELATATARSHGDPRLIAFALTIFGIGARKFGQLHLAAASFHEAAEASGSYGPLYAMTFARLGYINVLYLLGKLADSRMEMLDVLADVHESVQTRVLIAQFGTALATTLRDDMLFQRCFSPEILEAAFATNDAIQYAPLAAALAEHHLAEGDEPTAAALLERTLEVLPEGWDDCEVLLPVAVCCSPAAVEQARTRFRAGGKQTRNPFAEACGALFEAYAAARFGTREEKLRHAKLAAGLLRRLGMPLLEAEAYELGEQQARSVALCEQIGALRPARRLAQQSRRRAAATQLTAREREVVELALRRLTNSAIADELSLSERTVEAHLAAAYRKVGVRSRGELLSVISRAP